MESMILLVDSGATKAEWCVLDGSDVRDRFVTPGLNLSTQTQEATSAILQEAVTRLKSQGGRIREVHFFGAGLLDGDTSPLQALFPGADIEAASDLLAAARAVCGREPGIACILGTGSNSCLYDGKQIVRNVHPWASGFWAPSSKAGFPRLSRKRSQPSMKLTTKRLSSMYTGEKPPHATWDLSPPGSSNGTAAIPG